MLSPRRLRNIWLPLVFACLLSGNTLSVGVHAQVKPSQFEDEKREANENVVTIEGGQAITTYARMVEDIQNVLDESDRKNGFRVLPILGRGGGQNFLDILYLKGLDMGTVDQDTFIYFKKKDPKLFVNIEKQVQYILKLANLQLHLFVKPEIKKLEDLRGKRVGIFEQLSSAAIVMETIFSLCEVPVETEYYDQSLATEKFKSGELAGFARVAVAPNATFTPLSQADGHFLPIDPTVVPAGCYDKLLQVFLPAFLTHEEYPESIPEDAPIPTLADPTVLAVYAWPENSDRYRRLANFTKRLFDNIDKFQNPARNPAWKDINLAATVEGWQRFKPAQEWLDQHQNHGSASKASEIANSFEIFISGVEKTSGSTLTSQQRQALFAKFQKWMGQVHVSPAPK